VPKFLEEKLKAEYGADSAIPYKVMNARGYMRGNKETAKGAALDRQHLADARPKKKASSRSAMRTSAGHFDGPPTPPGMGSVSHKPRVLNNPPSFAGRRAASRQKAYG
jgi:hypothetical protein